MEIKYTVDKTKTEIDLTRVLIQKFLDCQGIVIVATKEDGEKVRDFLYSQGYSYKEVEWPKAKLIFNEQENKITGFAMGKLHSDNSIPYRGKCIISGLLHQGVANEKNSYGIIFPARVILDNQELFKKLDV